MNRLPSQGNATPRRRGAIAVVVHDERFLVIRRSEHVVAPGAFCFPGGGIEPGESEQQALVREVQEELGVAIHPLARVWQSTTRWQTELAWWLGHVDHSRPLVPNPLEVASIHWLSREEMLAESRLLESNRAFLEALERREIVLPA